MIGKFDSEGNLHIGRGEMGMVPQVCFQLEVDAACGCRCSLMSEPVVVEKGKVVLGVCRKNLLFEKFSDEREEIPEEEEEEG